MIENEDQKSGYFDLARAFAEAYEAVKFERHSAATKAKWADPFIRARIRARSILARANPEIREKMSQAIRQFYASPQGERLRRQISKRMT